MTDAHEHPQQTSTGEASEGHASEGHGHQGAHDASIAWPQVAASFVSFAVLMAILVKLIRKPLTTYFQSNSMQVRVAIEEASKLKEAAEQKQREYEVRLKNLDAEFARLRADLIRAGEKERDRILGEAEQRASRMRADVQFIISQNVKQLKEQVSKETSERVLKAAHEALKAEVTPADHERFAQAFLEQLKRVHAFQSTDRVKGGGGRISSLPPAFTSRSTALGASRSGVVATQSLEPPAVQEKA